MNLSLFSYQLRKYSYCMENNKFYITFSNIYFNPRLIIITIFFLIHMKKKTSIYLFVSILNTSR